MSWTLKVELTHKTWLDPIRKQFHYQGSLEQAVTTIQMEMPQIRQSDIWNLKHNQATTFMDVNNVKHSWKLVQDST